MHASADALALIRRFEGFAPAPYRCPAGYWTVGYGHRLMGPVGEHRPVTEAEAEELLRGDADRAAEAVARFIASPLTPGQCDALVSFTFNLGAAALQRSTLRQRINRGEADAAAGEFARWVFAAGRRLPGLVRRRAAEAAVYRGNSIVTQP